MRSYLPSRSPRERRWPHGRRRSSTRTNPTIKARAQVHEQEAEVLLGLGANVGNPARQLGEAVRQLERVVRVRQLSSVYVTEPVDAPDQPQFLNLVCRIGTVLTPHALLALTGAIEHRLGRVRTAANAPRTMDIDLLTYDDLVLESYELILPHPRMHQRGFVLVPLAEIAPHWRHPVLGKTAEELLQERGSSENVARWGKLE